MFNDVLSISRLSQRWISADLRKVEMEGTGKETVEAQFENATSIEQVRGVKNLIVMFVA